MGLIVVDTSVLIDNLRGLPETRQALDRAEAGDHNVVASVVTKVELLAGMRSHERRVARDLIDALDWVAVSDEIAEQAGVFARKFRSSHQGIGVADHLVAATVEHLGGELWTRNVKHFPMFPGLRVPY